jgi:hypothetical protein
VIAIPLVGATKCYEAAEWCAKEFQPSEWEMWMTESSWSKYTFEFATPESAAWFALKWAE